MIKENQETKEELQNSFDRHCKDIEYIINTTENKVIYDVAKNHLEWLKKDYKSKYNLK